jgi:predicted transcriptional regulator
VTEIDLDPVLMMLENPVRRRILERLSQEPAFPLQISKELGIGQQLVAKHLDGMEKVGLVKLIMMESPAGPKRKQYSLAKSLSVTIDLAPNLFKARVLSFDATPTRQITEPASSLIGRIENSGKRQDDSRSLGSLAGILEEIDGKMVQLEGERAILLYLRNLAMREASKSVTKMGKSVDWRRVLHYILDRHSRDIGDISNSLNLRESEVREIVSGLKKVL